MNSRAVPIRRKLSAISLTTCGIALLITTVLFLAGEFVVTRQASLNQLRTLSEAIASNSTAAMAFDNAEDASDVLDAFESEPHVEVAALYKPDGTLFATYPANAPQEARPPALEPGSYRFERASLIGVTEVREGNLLLGTLFVRSNMEAIYERLGVYALVAAIIIVRHRENIDRLMAGNERRLGEQRPA